jgi:hypothetical protein
MEFTRFLTNGFNLYIYDAGIDDGSDTGVLFADGPFAILVKPKGTTLIVGTQDDNTVWEISEDLPDGESCDLSDFSSLLNSKQKRLLIKWFFGWRPEKETVYK